MMLPPNLHRTLDDENPDDEALRMLGRQLRERGESYLLAAGYESEPARQSVAAGVSTRGAA